MNTRKYDDNEPINEKIQEKSRRKVLKEWLEHPDTKKDAWEHLTYQKIQEQIWTQQLEKISEASIAIHLPALVAAMTGKPVGWVLEVRKTARRNTHKPGAQIDTKRLQQLYADFYAGMDPKVCAEKLGMHYNTVLKYKRRWKATQTEHTNISTEVDTQ